MVLQSSSHCCCYPGLPKSVSEPDRNTLLPHSLILDMDWTELSWYFPKELAKISQSQARFWSSLQLSSGPAQIDHNPEQRYADLERAKDIKLAATFRDFFCTVFSLCLYLLRYSFPPMPGRALKSFPNFPFAEQHTCTTTVM